VIEFPKQLDAVLITLFPCIKASDEKLSFDGTAGGVLGVVSRGDACGLPIYLVLYGMYVDCTLCHCAVESQQV
jgi:hypothetical protein